MPDEVVAAAVPVESAPAPAISAPVESAPAGEPVSSTPVTTSPETAPVASPSEPAASAGGSVDVAKPASSTSAQNEFAPSLLDAAQNESAPAPQDGAPAPAGEKTEAPGERPSAPVKYEFIYPDGFDRGQVNDERMSAYTGVLGEAKVAPEVGQKLLDMHLAEQTRVAEAIAQRQWDVFQETQTRWKNEVMADPELGGGNHPAAISTIMSLVDQYGGNAAERAGLLDAFRITGAANNPHVLRFMHRAAQALSREAVPVAAPPPRSAPSSDPRERRMSSRYGTTTPPAR